MAEFVEVMRQRERMCKQRGNCCGDCRLSYAHNGRELSCAEYMSRYAAEAEQIIMAWAAEHPEPKYPSWNEAWKQLFPDAKYTTLNVLYVAPCLEFFLPKCQIDSMSPSERPKGHKCHVCRDLPIPADIAEKLGIKPLDG